MINKEQLLTDQQIQRFIMDGYTTVRADFPTNFHQNLCQSIDDVFAKEKNPGNNILPRLPQIQQVFDHPSVRGALTSILGPEYLMHPHRHCHLNPPGSPGQRWHKDNYVFDQNIRHPRPRWVLAFYYPQDVTEEMGPSTVIPGRHYHHHISTDDAALTTEIPLPICGPAGTVGIIHYDSWHRAGANLSNKNRYMLKFLFERLDEPQSATWDHVEPQWQPSTDDPLQPVHLDVWHWLAGRQSGNGQDNGTGTLAQGNGSLAQLMESLSDQDETIRLHAAYTLGAGADSNIPMLIDALREEAEAYADELTACLPGNVRGDNPATCPAAHALTAIGHPAVMPLADLLGHDHWCVRTIAADTIGNIGLPVEEIVPALTQRTDDEHPRVRRHAIEALGRMGATATEAIPHLIDHVRDDDMRVRYNAALALAKIGQPVNEAIPALVKTLADEDRYVRHFAAVALHRIGTPEAQKALMDAMFTARWCPITTTEDMY
ncbi:MAG: HEAT repeat domain-containing protein [Chloroflexota bacterium]